MTRENSEELVRRLVRDVPALQPSFQAHLDFTDGEVLSHPYFSEVTRQAQSWAGDPSPTHAQDVRRILNMLEAEFGRGNVEIDSLIALSFIESLDPRAVGYQEIRAMMGPKLLAELTIYESR